MVSIWRSISRCTSGEILVESMGVLRPGGSGLVMMGQRSKAGNRNAGPRFRRSVLLPARKCNRWPDRPHFLTMALRCSSVRHREGSMDDLMIRGAAVVGGLGQSLRLDRSLPAGSAALVSAAK